MTACSPWRQQTHEWVRKKVVAWPEKEATQDGGEGGSRGKLYGTGQGVLIL